MLNKRFFIEILSSLELNNLNFNKIQENAKNILMKLLSIDRNLFTKFRNIFLKIYLEVIGDIKSKIFQLFYNHSNFTKNSEEDIIETDIK